MLAGHRYVPRGITQQTILVKSCDSWLQTAFKTWFRTRVEEEGFYIETYFGRCWPIKNKWVHKRRTLSWILCSVQFRCTLGYSDFNNMMGFTSKKLLYIISTNFYLKILRISIFLRICIIRFKILLFCVLDDRQNVFLLIFLNMGIKNRNWKKLLFLHFNGQ